MVNPWDGRWFREIDTPPSGKFSHYTRRIVYFPGLSDVLPQVRNLSVKDGDVWIVAFPSSGSTWMQELVWLLTHNLDYEGAKIPLKQRTASLESAFMRSFHGNTSPENLSEFEKIQDMLLGTRIMKSHLHWMALPDALTRPNSLGKMIYVARNPKDVSVSYYYKHRCYNKFREDGISLDDFVQAFISDQVSCSPYWPHLLEFWHRRNDPSILLVKYEDMINNLVQTISQVAEFLRIPPLTKEQMQILTNHLSFENMAKNPAVNRKDETKPSFDEVDEDGKLMREGKVGCWKGKFSSELLEKFNAWIRYNTKNTDIVFRER